MAAAVTLPTQFFPQTEHDIFQLSMTLPPATSLEHTRARTAAATALLESYDGVEDVVWVLGQSAPRVYYNVVRLEGGRGLIRAGVPA